VNDIEKGTQAINRMEVLLPGPMQDQPKTIYMHVQDPIAKTIHDEPKNVWLHHVQCISSAGIILEESSVTLEPVIGRIIYAPKLTVGPR
jgi:hypothetical protein